MMKTKEEVVRQVQGIYRNKLSEKQAEIRFLRLQLMKIRNNIDEILISEYYSSKKLRVMR